MNSTPQVDIVRYALRHINVAWVSDAEQDKQPSVTTDSVRTSYDYEVFKDKEDPAIYAMNLRLKFETMTGEKATGYKIETAISGVFKVNETMPKDKEQYLLRVNSVSILYGVLRGLIGGITASFDTGIFVLPSIMPQEIVEKTEATKAALKKQAEQLKAQPAQAGAS